MNTLAKQIWIEDDGVLTFEWTLLIVLVVFGIVGGLAAARDVMIDELGDTAQAILAFDQSYSFAGIPGVIGPSVYEDPGHTFEDCNRGGVAGQGTINDGT
jgi:hypothetical protein